MPRVRKRRRWRYSIGCVRNGEPRRPIFTADGVEAIAFCGRRCVLVIICCDVARPSKKTPCHNSSARRFPRITTASMFLSATGIRRRNLSRRRATRSIYCAVRAMSSPFLRWNACSAFRSDEVAVSRYGNDRPFGRYGNVRIFDRPRVVGFGRAPSRATLHARFSRRAFDPA